MARKRYAILSIIVRTVVGLAALVGAIVVYLLLFESRPIPARTDRGNAAPRVIVMAAEPTEVRQEWEGFGTVRAMDAVNVPARVSATVRGVPDEILAGATVTKGQLLVELDDSDFLRQEEISKHSVDDVDAQLERLEIEVVSWTERTKLAAEQVELARAEFERVEEAMRRDVAKQREVDQARQALLTSIRDEVGAREEYDKLVPRRSGLAAQKLGFDAQRRLARQSVERCRILSPLDGVLEAVDVEVGESLQIGHRVARVVDLTRLELPLRLPSSARLGIRPGDLVRITPGGDVGRMREATVSRIAPADDEQTRTATVYVEIAQDPASALALTPGQFMRARVVSSVQRERWIVPRRSVNGDRVLVVRDGRVMGKTVEVDFQIADRFPALGVPDEQWVVLVDALQPGDLVVVTPSRALADGLAVLPVVAGDAAHADSAGGDAATGLDP
jgi:HlyD family secretion protein